MLLGAAPAAARPDLSVAATSPHPGWIGLRVRGGAPRSLVSVRERGTLLAHVRLDAAGRGKAGRVARWRCAPRVRTLTIHAGRAGVATATTRTPSCARRLALQRTPRAPRAGGRLTVRVIDRWHQGGLDLCLTLVSPAGTRACHQARLARGEATLRLKAPRTGRWTIDVRGPGVGISHNLRIRPAGDELSVVAAGDSMMAPVARALKRTLLERKAARVVTDVHYGTGISNSFVLDWPAHAAETAPVLRADVVVLFIGGHEGWPFGPVECCGAPWIAEYAARARAITETYLRRGAAQVYWLGLPAPGNPDRVPVIRAADAGLAAGIEGLEPWARRLDMSAIFTPGFMYRSVMPVDELLTEVRMADGLHLTPIGGTIAARAVLAAFEQDGVLPRLRGPVASPRPGTPQPPSPAAAGPPPS
jgi:hypothetical protein